MVVDEIWKPIKDYEGLYEVSNKGRVKSLQRYTESYNKSGEIKQNHKEKILKNNIMKSGYVMITLFKNGKPKSYFIHRLVAQVFVPNPENNNEVNHKDENKSNNNFENLEWCTRKYNNVYSRARKVCQYDLEGNFIAEYESCYEASRQTKAYESNIRNCCKGKSKTTGGFKWKYAE